MYLLRMVFNSRVSISGVERSGWTSTELVSLETMGNGCMERERCDSVMLLKNWRQIVNDLA
jgi:hypothetical protein